MKDKEEQITEMAIEICSHCLEMAEVCPYANTEDESGNEACFTERLHEAENFYNAGYRKIPEDSVVLSREEYERLNECYKVRAFNKLRAENKQLKDRIAELETLCNKTYEDLTKEIDRLEKEKTEQLKEFAEKVEQAICDNTYPYFDKNGKPVNIWNIDGFDRIDELLKEFIDG